MKRVIFPFSLLLLVGVLAGASLAIPNTTDGPRPAPGSTAPGATPPSNLSTGAPISDGSGTAPSPEEQARQLQEQLLALLLSRLDGAATLMGQGHTKEAIVAYLQVFLMEPNFDGLSAQKSDLSTRMDALQQQIFATQRQAAQINSIEADDMAAQMIGMQGQLGAVLKLLALKPSFAEAHSNLAHLLVESGAAGAGLQQYRQAIHLRPGLETSLRPAIVHAHLVEADRLAKLGSADAQSEYEEAIKLDPSNASAHVGLGSALMTQGNNSDAVQQLSEALRLDPGNGDAGLTLGLALYQSGRREEARRQWRSYEQNPDPQIAAQARGMLDRYLLNPKPQSEPPKDAYDAEVRRCREVVQNYPNEAFAHNNLASALFDAKQLDEALQEVHLALQIDPDSIEAHSNLGLILNDRKDPDSAIEEFHQALRLDSDNGAVHNNLGVVYFDREQWKQAEFEFRKALQGDHSDPYAHHNLADTLLREGRLAESIKECGKTLRYDPSFSAAYGTRGLVEDRMGDAARGTADLQQAVSMAPDPGQALLDLADQLRQFAGRDVATRQFEKILRLYPETAGGDEALGRFLLADDQLPEATRQFQASLRLQPDRVSAHLLLTRVFLRQSRLEEAAQEAREALRLEPGSGEARNMLGLALYQSGQKEEAREQWKSALAQDDKDAARNAEGLLKEFP